MNPETNEFRRSELPGKYTAKILFGWDDRKFKDEYLKKLERNLEEKVISELKIIDLVFVTNFIQLVFLQPVNQFSQTKLH